MVSMPAAKKDPSVRARANKASTAATLSATSTVDEIPELPDDREWHPMTLAWWAEVWDSPMASEFIKVDVRGLMLLAVLEDDFWTATSASARKEAANEIRLQRKDFGLTPYDRRRLEWTIENADEAKDRGEQRRKKRNPQPAPDVKDPRNVLRAV